jgi:hypothetical protein
VHVEHDRMALSVVRSLLDLPQHCQAGRILALEPMG